MAAAKQDVDGRAKPGHDGGKMLTSRDRILTTHVGSLPRNETITELLIKREAGEAIDPKRMTDELDRAVGEVVQKQKDAGIDIGNDGEQQRVAFQTYMAARMSGYGGESKRRVGKDFVEHPDLVATFGRRFVHRAKISNAPQAIADVKYEDVKPINAEIARFKKFAAGAFAEAFMTAPSPGIVATTLMNAHYDSHEAYLNALAGEIAKEYRAIHDAGLILQVDAPDLAMERVMMFQDESDAGFVKIAEAHMAAINKATAGIPADRWRLHICWGNWEGPHVYDIGLAKVLPVFYQANAGALSIEFANPRHQHEYAAFRQHPFPKDKILIPGVIESTSNFVEHPEVVAGRIEQAVAAVGDRERVIASTDCGFGTFAGREWVAASIVWPKLKTMREGADLASQRLWGKKVA
jgi:5-methyltetrahydropteroyltriglutamate--homocysteine methyltransferase